MGVEHALLPERAWWCPGTLDRADSHTYIRRRGAFSTGIGSTDMAAGMATGEAWFKVPEAIRFVLTGKPGKWVSGKTIPHIIGMIGADMPVYKSMEFTETGSNIFDGRQVLTANMAIEAG